MESPAMTYDSATKVDTVYRNSIPVLRWRPPGLTPTGHTSMMHTHLYSRSGQGIRAGLSRWGT
eukprot:902327-Prymnesium_polylepis.1